MDTALQPAAIPTSDPDLTAQLSAILTGVAVAPITDRAFIRITGPDATRWLNGMVTNNIQDLQPGEGNYNFLLNAQGRIIGDCTIYRDPAPDPRVYLLQTDTSQVETIQQHLEKFIIMDDVELVSAPSIQNTLLLLGPRTPAILHAYYRGFRGADHSTLAPLRLAFDPEAPDQVSTPSPSIVPQFEVHGDTEPLSNFALTHGATPVSAEALEHLRILSGTPRYGIDIRNTATAHDLPQETAQKRALHFSKGCYLGQEIVERIHSRGNVHRTFSGFELSGALPAPGTTLTAEGKAVGELTSVAAIPLARPVQLALGYIRREAIERKLPLDYPGGTAIPIPLPYAIP